MEFSVKKIEPTVAEVHFKTTKEELNEAFEKAYKKAAQKVKIPGFRVGKTPIEIVKKHLGDSVIEDALEILLIDTYNSILEKLDPKPISLPLFNIKEVDKEKGVEFIAEYEFFPEIEISKYKKMKAKSFEIEEDPTLVDDILKSYAKKYPTFLPKEFEDDSKNIVEEKDIVLLDLKIFKEKYNKELYHIEEYEVDLINPEPNFPELKNHILGKKVGDEVEFTTRMGNSKDFPKASNKNVVVKVKILEIRYEVPSEINDEFAKFFQFESLEDFKKDIQESIGRKAKEFNEIEILKQIMQEIIEKNPFDLPNVVINQEVKARLEDLSKRLGLTNTITFEQLSLFYRKSPEEIEKEFKEQATRDLKTQIILDKIIELEKIDVSSEEISEEIKNTYGKYITTDEQLKELEKNENIVNNIKAYLKREKAIKWLIENSEIKKGDKISTRKLYEEGKIKI